MRHWAALTGAVIALLIAASATPAAAAERANWAAGPVARGTGYWSGQSERVREVQRALRVAGLHPGRVDGLFGPRTERAVVRFQRRHDLSADGIVGPRTLHRLRLERADRPPHAPRVRAPRPPAPPATGPAPILTAPPAPAPQWPLALVLFALLGLSTLVGGKLLARRPGPSAARPRPELLLARPQLLLAPPRPAADTVPVISSPPGNRLGDLLQRDGSLSRHDLYAAIEEQRRSGGRLGEILVATGVVPPSAVTAALGRQLGVPPLRDADIPVALLPAHEARAWRAVALNDGREVALTDPGALAPVRARLGRFVEPRLCDEATLDGLLGDVYADDDAYAATRGLHERTPELSAYRTGLSRTQAAIVAVVIFLLAFGIFLDIRVTATVLVGLSTAFFVASTGFRLYAAWHGTRTGATIDPSPEELAAVDERDLPTYSILLPLYKEKPATVRTLFAALARLDYPKHKLDGLLLIEADDAQTRTAIDAVGRPPWLRVLSLPGGMPRTKPRAMDIGLRYARGTLVTVYDAEDKPDPAQLKKAAWGFAHADDSLACLQAKLGYYNPRQNLLTRWFTLEYDGWFNIMLPGLHRIGAPIPLGGTSNHFRREALERCRGWDPYNVTEDADLGLRFARLGLKTAMLESETGEEANSRVANWLRQRSRWSKGYIQTVLVHTRRPGALVRDLGPKATAAFLLTLGGAVVTALLAPIFWLLLITWIYFQPDWIAAVFPGLIFHPASASLVLGNFALVMLVLSAAVIRGHDDLAKDALLAPCYWLLISIATYMALVDVFVRPHHWHKTEHGLHLAEEPT